MEKFKLSDRTLKILQNFTQVNTRIIIDPGSIIYSSREDSMYAWTSVEEEFPFQIRVYNLSELVNIIQKFDEPYLDMREEEVWVKSGRSRVRYGYTPLKILRHDFPKLPFESIDLPPGCQQVSKISSDDIMRLRKLSSTMNLTTLELVIKKGKSLLRVSKGKDSEGDNKFEIGLTEGLDIKDCKASIDLNKFLLLKDDYQLYIVPGKAIVLSGEILKVNYMLMVDVDQSEF